MSVNLPTPLPVAEPGIQTTEFKALVAVFAQAVLASLGAFGVLHISDAQRAAVLELEGAFVTLATAAYALGRSIRKRGTQG